MEDLNERRHSLEKDRGRKLEEKKKIYSSPIKEKKIR